MSALPWLQSLLAGLRQYPQTVRQQSVARTLLQLAGTLLGLVLLYQLWLFLWVCWYSIFNPWSSAIMNQQQAILARQNPPVPIRHEWVDYAQISSNLKKAVIASEDANFVAHQGIEWDAIRQAWRYNTAQSDKGRNKIRGGSTISQQLAKNLFLSNDRSYLRKGQELIITFMLETVMSKERILELYLNLAEWGTGIFGAQAASQHYYKTNANKLSQKQAAQLAVLLPNPRVYGANIGSRYVQSRTRTIQARMKSAQIPDTP
ncbi:monofunctional biosynthetic peptidoglycan transglycosylase [Advenella sp. RU8]|uniref:monofunctional biosynthetic peptidoglycan transglycosylase n=1 Tax=Advenella sp. RU8 TaxID=3399575 RepID=UPI003AB0ECE9